jgi:2-polyprenyl-6-methoxyphenol hydroxylase-like FAD-dependent oxidoreductase
VKILVETLPIEIRLGVEVEKREISTNGITLIDRHGKRHGPFDFVISGDGSRSHLRKAFGFAARVIEYEHGTLWAIAPAAKVQGRLLQIVRGTRLLFGLLPLGNGLSTLYWGLPARDFERTRRRGLPALKREILAFAPEAEEVLEFIHDYDQLLPTTYRHVRMSKWYDSHVLFMGDSAHAMSPHLGQGINLAMVDAWRFAQCLRKARDPFSAFAAFRAMQREYIAYYSLVTMCLSPFFQSDWDLLAWGRDLVLPYLPHIPWVKQQMLMTVAGLKGGFLKGEITIAHAK